MAMNPNDCADFLKISIIAQDPTGSFINPGPQLDALCLGIATGIVGYFVLAATVIPGTFVAPPGTAGGPVTGTGKVT